MSTFIPEHSTNEIYRDENLSRFLTTDLEDIESTLANKSDSDHTHSGYAPTSHTHSGYATTVHTHSSDDISGLADALALKADASAITAKADLVDGKVPASQLPSFVDDVVEYNGVANFPTTGESGKIYVDSSANTIYRWSGSAYVQIPTSVAVGETANCAHRGDHGKHAYDHSVNGDWHVTPSQKTAWDSKAAGDHDHATVYAAIVHDHDDVLHTTGGTINGAVNVNGVIRANEQQAFYYNTSTNSQTIGTNNATGGTVICCGSDANVTINGANVKTKNTIPQGSNTYALGSTTYRWKNIYANNAVNVASDRRLKRDIFEMDADKLAEFVDKLSVVSYNYNDDPENAQSRIGLIAQDVQEADSDLAKFFVSEGEDGMLGMTPANLVFALIGAVQRLSAEIAELKAAK